MGRRDTRDRIAPDLRPLARPIDQLRLDPDNARLHPRANLDTIRASLTDHGQLRPVVCTADGLILAGNGTFKAAKALRWSHLAAVVYATEEAAQRRFALVDNRSAELAAWDPDLLGVNLRAANAGATPFDVTRLGWTTDEIRARLKASDQAAPGAGDQAGAASSRSSADAGAEAGRADDQADLEDRRVKLQRTWKTALGQAWEIPSLTTPGGVHRLAICDSIADPAAADALVFGPGERAAAVVTDPPYAIYGSATGVASDVTDDRMVRPFFLAVLNRIGSALPWFGHFYVATDWRSWAALWEAARGANVPILNCIVWDKGNADLGSNYQNTHEFFAFGARLPKQTTMGNRHTGQRSVYRPNVLRAPRLQGNDRLHNAAKPTDVLAEFVRNSTDAGGLVLDLFLGSGSTFLACEAEGRLGRGFASDPGYAAATLERFARRGFEPRLVDLVGASSTSTAATSATEQRSEK